ncbi:hypothetical protein O3Q51_18120 [Cryomorphaceae bacterium 1068]|nr:hypothetical protein [Cryomorphaceae bacterium 1068]
MGNLTLEYPTWALLLCPIAGLLFAGLLYFRNRSIAELSKGALWTLSTLRFLLVTIATFLLLGPLVRYFDISFEPPVIAIVADNSSSLVMGEDSSATAQSVKDIFSQLSNDFSADYEVATYTFGSQLNEGNEIDFSEPVTDISAVFSSLNDRYANRNLGAVVLLSDGIYNRGRNPRYLNNGLNAPIYAVAFGDTTVKRDARIAETAANRIAFLGNSFPIEAVIEADKMQGSSARFSISHKGEVLFSETIDYNREVFSTTIRAVLEAKEPGLQRYSLSLQYLGEESTEINNTTSVFIDVLDDRQEVLVLGNSPHPDLKALREAIVSNDNYKVEVALASDFEGDFTDFDLVILHQLPSATAAGRRIEKTLSEGTVPIWVIVGKQTTLNSLTNFGLGVSLVGRSNSTNDVKGEVNTNFSLFKLDDGVNNLVQEAPPLQVPFGQWSQSNSTETLLYQKVGRIRTDDALLVINSSNQGKSATLLGEGLWRWRLTDYAINENHEVFDSFVGSLVQYLAVKEDKRLFRAYGPELAMENEALVFRAELYNPSYESINDADVELLIKSEDGTEFPYFFSRTPQAYRLDVGSLPAGNYTYEAFLNKNGERLSDSGSFGVKPFALEGARLRADHQTLNLVSVNSGGAIYYPGDVSKLIQRLNQGQGELKPVSYTNEIFSSILNFRWIFFILLLLLSAEWFIRKYLGSY